MAAAASGGSPAPACGTLGDITAPPDELLTRALRSAAQSPSPASPASMNSMQQKAPPVVQVGLQLHVFSGPVRTHMVPGAVRMHWPPAAVQSSGVPYGGDDGELQPKPASVTSAAREKYRIGLGYACCPAPPERPTARLVESGPGRSMGPHFTK
jgi:hypothetical protein